MIFFSLKKLWLDLWQHYSHIKCATYCNWEYTKTTNHAIRDGNRYRTSPRVDYVVCKNKTKLHISTVDIINALKTSSPSAKKQISFSNSEKNKKRDSDFDTLPRQFPSKSFYPLANQTAPPKIVYMSSPC